MLLLPSNCNKTYKSLCDVPRYSFYSKPIELSQNRPHVDYRQWRGKCHAKNIDLPY